MQVLKQIILDSLQAEKHLEIVRQILMDNNKINPKLLFMHISDSKDKITAQDLQSLLSAHLIRFSSQELAKLIKKTSTYSAFLSFILPSNYQSLKQLNSFNRIQQNHDDQLFMESFHVVLKIFELELQIIRKMIANSEQLVGVPLPNPKSITQLLHKLEISATSDDIVAILRRLDFDGDADFKAKDLETLIAYSQSKHPQPQFQPQPRSPSLREGSFTQPQPVKCVSFRQRNSEHSIQKQNQKQKQNENPPQSEVDKENQQPNVQQKTYLENLKSKYTIQKNCDEVEQLRQEGIASDESRFHHKVGFGVLRHEPGRRGGLRRLQNRVSAAGTGSHSDAQGRGHLHAQGPDLQDNPPEPQGEALRVRDQAAHEGNNQAIQMISF